jgi:hypothetical protein
MAEQHENMFRVLNERIRLLVLSFQAFAEEETIPFVCECSDGGCFAPVELTLACFEAVRTTEGEFVLAPGHLAQLWERSG